MRTILEEGVSLHTCLEAEEDSKVVVEEATSEQATWKTFLQEDEETSFQEEEVALKVAVEEASLQPMT